jgi:Leucine-rich repeat (LRR) protein
MEPSQTSGLVSDASGRERRERNQVSLPPERGRATVERRGTEGGLPWCDLPPEKEPVMNETKTCRDLGEALRNPAAVEALDLSALRLASFPLEILRLDNLQSLDVSRNSFEFMPRGLGRLRKLRHLNLEDTEIHELPADFFELEGLVTLALRFTKLESIDFRRLCRLRRLKTLTLPMMSGPFELPAAFCDLTDLEELVLWGVGLPTLPEDFGRLHKLKRLILGSCDLEELPESFFELTELEELDLEAADLVTLGRGIGNLRKLRTLNLQRVPLAALPAEIGNLQSLRTLALGSSQLKRLPAELGRLAALEELELSSCPFPSFPAPLLELRGLKKLTCRQTRLGQLPEAIGELEQLTELSLENAGISALPESIGRLRGLTKLELSGNPLEALPESIGRLEALDVLSLNRCSLSELPESIGDLKRLRCLWLRANRLTDLPRAFGRLQSLRILDLSENKLGALPEAVLELTQLERLSLTANSFSAAEVRAVEDFARKLREAGHSGQIEMPRTVKRKPRRKVSSERLSEEVIAQFRRLGGAFTETPAPEAPARVTIGEVPYEMPEAMRQLQQDLHFEPGPYHNGSLGSLELKGVHFWARGAAEEYEAVKNEPYLELGMTRDGCLLLVHLNDADPADPEVYFLDHDDFWEVEATGYGVKLSEFLRGLEPEGQEPAP